MLNNATGFDRIYIACGYTDLRQGIDGLCAVIYSLVETAKANKLKIYEYLKYLLTEIQKHMEDTNLDFLEDLLPWSEKAADGVLQKSLNMTQRDSDGVPLAILSRY